MTASRPAVRVALATVLVAGLGLLGTACGGAASDSGSNAKTDIGETAATVKATSTTTAAPVATTGAPAAAPTGLPGQEEVVQKLYDAWFANDKVTAATVADPMAIDAMWQTAKGDYSLYNSCSTGEFDTSGCLYRGNNGTIQFDLEKRGDNWVVAGAFYSDPSSGG